MLTEKEIKALLKKRKSLYRYTFRKNMGYVTLGDILAGPCRFFGRIDAKDQISDEEMYIRQEVGREILRAMDAFPGEGCTVSPEVFVMKMLSVEGAKDVGRKRSDRRS